MSKQPLRDSSHFHRVFPDPSIFLNTCLSQSWSLTWVRTWNLWMWQWRSTSSRAWWMALWWYMLEIALPTTTAAVLLFNWMYNTFLWAYVQREQDPHPHRVDNIVVDSTKTPFHVSYYKKTHLLFVMLLLSHCISPGTGPVQTLSFWPSVQTWTDDVPVWPGVICDSQNLWNPSAPF